MPTTTSAVTAGIVSIMSKMGISTVQSYHSAQIFEAVGFQRTSSSIRYFAGTVSRVGGMGIADVQREENQRYDDALAILQDPAPDQLPTLGLTKWRPAGRRGHILSTRRPSTCCSVLVEQGDYDLFQEYSAHVHRAGRADSPARPARL